MQACLDHRDDSIYRDRDSYADALAYHKGTHTRTFGKPTCKTANDGTKQRPSPATMAKWQRMLECRPRQPYPNVHVA